MDIKERELEELVNDVEKRPMSIPPLFELYVTFFSIAIAIMLFAYPDMIDVSTKLYQYMENIMPQAAWALCFCAACMLKAIGLLINVNWLRVSGLVASVALYVTLAFCYAMSWPSIGTIIFSLMAIFAAASIPFVKHTSIRIK
ncbi:hypothetical protein [Oceanobacillus sojae]|uniref:hypothetical protein n=1 Tax=Oceanobacillus sojae TaxID=582851 RepID=UPI00363C9333